ncbi:hypothetical protein EVAR_100002_1 [Eumeta japonica]|uniref:Uncharacterized protein n=1 Tax=Eumeta variegata TaxID=151549 RepID=A0A4C2A975_EUMVA|nr:hypothetical protein EVAR_100002_1 [Eumeta japonica]
MCPVSIHVAFLLSDVGVLGRRDEEEGKKGVKEFRHRGLCVEVTTSLFIRSPYSSHSKQLAPRQSLVARAACAALREERASQPEDRALLEAFQTYTKNRV